MTTNTKIKKPCIRGVSKTVPIDSIEGNSWNPNVQSKFKFEQTKKVIAEFGFLDPCTVRTAREKGKPFDKPQIIDGEHRWKAAKELGITEVLVQDVGRMSDAKAQVLTDVLNNLHGENDALKWSAMVKSINDIAPELIQFLPYQANELDEVLKPSEIDWDAFESGDDPVGPRDDNGKLYKKFSVSLPEATMTRAADVMRKVKAAHGLDNDSAAFALILDGFDAHVAAQASAKSEPEADGGDTQNRRRRRRTKVA